MAAWPSSNASASRTRQSPAACQARSASELGASRSAVRDAQRTALTPITAPAPTPTSAQNRRLTGAPPPTAPGSPATPPQAPAAAGRLALGGLAGRLAQPVGEGAQPHQRAGDRAGDHVDQVADRA